MSAQSKLIFNLKNVSEPKVITVGKSYFFINDLEIKPSDWSKIKNILDETLAEDNFIMITFYHDDTYGTNKFIVRTSEIISIETVGF